MLPVLLGLGALLSMQKKRPALSDVPRMQQAPALDAPRCENGLPCSISVLTWFNHRSSDLPPSGGGPS